jgi:predicted amidohydrolase
MKQKITLVEFSIQLGNFDKNLSSGIEDIQSAASAGSRLVLLPELWTTGYTLEDGLSCAHNNQLALTELQSLSTNLNIIIGGTYLLEENGSIFNTFILLSPDEKAPTLYRKIHLFGLMEEDRHLTAGRQPVMVNSSIGKIGLSICYDLRFPELFRGYALQGAEIILLPAEWPVERISHWDTLIRARD